MSVQCHRNKWSAKVRYKGELFYIGTFGSESAARAASDVEIERIRSGTSELSKMDGTISLRAYAAASRVRLGTLKRWVHEGMPHLKIAGLVRVVESHANKWVVDRYPGSIAIGRQAVVYVAQRSRDNAVKIGWTSDVERRMRELRKTGDDVVLIAARPGDKPLELKVQDQFAGLGIGGEWYAVDVGNAVAALLGAS